MDYLEQMSTAGGLAVGLEAESTASERVIDEARHRLFPKRTEADVNALLLRVRSRSRSLDKRSY